MGRRWRWRTTLLWILATIAAPQWHVHAEGLAASAGPVRGDTKSQVLAYAKGRGLYLQPIAGGKARVFATPWPVTSIAWSPDGRDLAISAESDTILGQTYRLAVLDVATGRLHSLFSDSCPDGTGPCLWPLEWSPNGRYLAYSRGEIFTKVPTTSLWLWDQQSGHIRLLANDLSMGDAVAVWAHDSNRLAIAAGASNYSSRDTPPVNSSTAVFDIATGRTVAVSYYGPPDSWSPDDRYIALHRYGNCLHDQGCFGQAALYSMRTRAVTPLGDYEDTYDNSTWAKNPAGSGYLYDRWLLNAQGKVTHAIGEGAAKSGALPLLSVAPTGRYALVQSETPGEAAMGTKDTSPARIALESASGKRTVLETEQIHAEYMGVYVGRYITAWSASGATFAFASPFPATTTVQIGSIGSRGAGRLRAVSLSGWPMMSLQFTADNRYLIVAPKPRGSDTADVYRYSLAGHTLTPLARGVAAAAVQPAGAR